MKSKIIFLLFVCFIGLNAQNLSGIKICVNPGHGGFDSDDRNMVIAPFTSGDHNGFWESQSNLDKGKQLRDMLVAAGATVIITRITNTTADDLPLTQIVAMANQGNVDFMIAIHSNSGSGVANNILQLYAGKELNDTYTYPTSTPLSDKSREISTVIAKNLYTNQITSWSSAYSVVGDKTFGRTAMGWSDGYGVLRGLTVPGVISEGSMHDYIPETYRLMNMEYKWLEAWHFFKSFCAYFNGGTIQTGNIAGMVRDSRIKLESTYNKFVGRDQQLPLNGTKLTLIESGEIYTVDQMQNGVYLFKNLIPGIYHVKAELSGYYSQTQEIMVTPNNVSYFHFALNKVRNTPPMVIAYSPNVLITDSVEASTSIAFDFNWDMDEQTTSQAFSITPNVSGKITFEDTNYRMRFTPDFPLDKSTIYTVKLAKTASHPDNLSMGEDFSFQFLTKNRNRLALLAIYPTNDNNGVYFNSPSFRLIFDRKLNTSNIQTAIKVLDENGVVLTKNARSVLNNSIALPYGSSYFNLSANLIVGKDYRLIVDEDVTDEVGMKVVEPIEIRFRAADVQKNIPTLMDACEVLNYVYASDLSESVGNATVSLSTTKLFGTYSNRLTVPFLNSNAKAIFGLIQPIDVTTNKVIGVHLNGDLSGNEVWLQFSIPGGVQYLKLCDLNFYGWEFHEINLSELSIVSNWVLTAVKIIRKTAYPFSSFSDIYLDNILLYDKSILSTCEVSAKPFKVYPNPSKDKIIISGDVSEKTILKLYSLNGSLIKESEGNQLNVYDVENGTYILKINNKDISFATPIFVVK